MPNVVVDPVNKTCTPDRTTIRGRDGSNVSITFQIDPQRISGWSWSRSTNPVVVQADSGKFSGGGYPAGGGKATVQVTDRNQRPGDVGSYKYTVTLVQDGTNPPNVATIDPWIENEAENK